MKIRNVFFSRRKWLKVSGIASVGGLFSGIIIPQQCNRIKDSNKPSPYSTKPPLRKSARINLIKKKNHYQIIYQSLKNIENEIAESIGIKQERIRFTSYVDKFEFLEDFDIHFDDDVIEIELINEHLPNCKAILIK